MPLLSHITAAFRGEFGSQKPSRSRSNLWPRCSACHRRVPCMCPEGCSVCPGCCPGHEDDEP